MSPGTAFAEANLQLVVDVGTFRWTLEDGGPDLAQPICELS